jgi:hypothetical protein
MNLFYQNIPRHPLIVKFPTVQALVEAALFVGYFGCLPTRQIYSRNRQYE